PTSAFPPFPYTTLFRSPALRLRSPRLEALCHAAITQPRWWRCNLAAPRAGGSGPDAFPDAVLRPVRSGRPPPPCRAGRGAARSSSEEQTSELHSRGELV